jgi:hypothetical protein
MVFYFLFIIQCKIEVLDFKIEAEMSFSELLDTYYKRFREHGSFELRRAQRIRQAIKKGVPNRFKSLQ